MSELSRHQRETLVAVAETALPAGRDALEVVLGAALQGHRFDDSSSVARTFNIKAMN